MKNGMLPLELPQKFRELRAAEERLVVDGQEPLSRTQAQVRLTAGKSGPTLFAVDWHLVALPSSACTKQDELKCSTRASSSTRYGQTLRRLFQRLPSTLVLYERLTRLRQLEAISRHRHNLRSA
jgi:hypothetical protein